MQAALAVKDDLPCYERIVTVSGNAVHKPGNYRVRIGTLYSHLVEQGAQGLKNAPARIISGGPMMGFSLHSLDFPVLKGTGGLLLLITSLNWPSFRLKIPVFAAANVSIPARCF